MKQYVTITTYVRATREIATKFWLELGEPPGMIRGVITRIGQWVLVKLAHNDIIEGNDLRGFIKLRNFKFGCISRKKILVFKGVSLYSGTFLTTSFNLTLQLAYYCATTGYYAASSGNFLQTFRGKLSFPFLGLKYSFLGFHFVFLNAEDGTIRLSRNVGRKLPPLACVITQQSAVLR